MPTVSVTLKLDGPTSKILQALDVLKDFPEQHMLSATISVTGLLDFMQEHYRHQTNIDVPIDDLIAGWESDKSLERARNCLRRAQIDTIAELMLYSSHDLLAITNFSQKCLDLVRARLAERGLTLRGE